MQLVHLHPWDSTLAMPSRKAASTHRTTYGLRSSWALVATPPLQPAAMSPMSLSGMMMAIESANTILARNKKLTRDSMTIEIAPRQSGPTAMDPYYIMLSNLENDAICVASIAVSNEKISSTIYGDTGYTCGQSWFLSDNKIGSDFERPRFVWLDADHTNKINASAMSFHLNDFASAADKIQEYTDMPKTLCQSTQRFAFWGNMLPDGIIPFFKPKLQYNMDSQSNGEGADVNPGLVIDKLNQYNRGIYLHQGEKPSRAIRSTRRDASGNVTATWNHNPEHLIITNHPQDDVREVCEHPSSYGWDIVSTTQKLYCDMETKRPYNVCDGQGTKEDCFDMNNKTIVPKCGVNARDDLAVVPLKAYSSEARWQA